MNWVLNGSEMAENTVQTAEKKIKGREPKGKRNNDVYCAKAYT